MRTRSNRRPVSGGALLVGALACTTGLLACARDAPSRAQDPAPTAPESAPPADVGDVAESDDPFLAEGCTDLPEGYESSSPRIEGRFEEKEALRAAGGQGTEAALADALAWLVAHQDDDGKWDADGFMKHDPADDRTDGPGSAVHDVGVTSLAVLALMADGNTTREGPHKDRVSRAVKWLKQQQDMDSGRVGPDVGVSFLYDHGIATVALTEAYYASKSPLLKGSAQKATNFVTVSRNPYGAWRYDSPPVGESDTSVTGWMVLALESAEDAGLRIDDDAFRDALGWFDEMTDPATGRTGYTERGSRSSRLAGQADRFPVDTTETMTSVALLCRSLLGQRLDDHDVMRRGADLLLEALPEYEEGGASNDIYYWYYGSYAMFQLGGRYWSKWNDAMKSAVLAAQRRDGAAKGSFDPDGPWGIAGGRVYATALGALCLEVYFRYPRALDGR